MRNDADLLMGCECFEGQPKGNGLRTVVVHLEVRGATVHNVVDGGQSRHVVFMAFERVSLPDLTRTAERVFDHFARFGLDCFGWYLLFTFDYFFPLT